MVDVLIRPPFDRELDTENIVRAAQAALEHQKAPSSASLCIVITDDDEIQALNLQFRGIDAPTDVLSFGMQDESLSNGQTTDTDFIVAPEQAADQDHQQNHGCEAAKEDLRHISCLRIGQQRDQAEHAEKHNRGQAGKCEKSEEADCHVRLRSHG